MSSAIPFAKLKDSDLVVDRLYPGGPHNNIKADPINILVPGAGNQGGIRPGSRGDGEIPKFVVLYTSQKEAAWPDALDPYSGLLTYFGDNRKPGNQLHDTNGNSLLCKIFEWASDPSTRNKVPPVFVFEKASPGRAVLFRGIAVPGAESVAHGDDLVAVWRSINGNRFQNYRGLFTIVSDQFVSRSWLKSVHAGTKYSSPDGPEKWLKWHNDGKYTPLISTTIDIRSKKLQLPQKNSIGASILKVVHGKFEKNPYAFEACAVALWKLLAPNTGEVTLTRPWRDGGRDAVGSYLFGPPSDKLSVNFALEAKCYACTNGIGVKEMSRLISRLQHRQFGVFVTTSYFGDQAYKEVRNDGHPVVLIAGADIIAALHTIGRTDESSVQQWVNQF